MVVQSGSEQNFDSEKRDTCIYIDGDSLNIILEGKTTDG